LTGHGPGQQAEREADECGEERESWPHATVGSVEFGGRQWRDGEGGASQEQAGHGGVDQSITTRACPLASFHPLIQAWWQRRFALDPGASAGTARGAAATTAAFAPPTPAQADGWEAIRAGHDTLIAAPTGSGKTLAAFLHSIDALT